MFSLTSNEPIKVADLQNIANQLDNAIQHWWIDLSMKSRKTLAV